MRNIMQFVMHPKKQTQFCPLEQNQQKIAVFLSITPIFHHTQLGFRTCP